MYMYIDPPENSNYSNILLKLQCRPRNQPPPPQSQPLDRMCLTACLWDEGIHKSDINEQ